MSVPAIELENVTKAYDPAKPPAVREVSLAVAQGEVLALVGGSGSGKTTTLKMINRLIEPTSGTIRVLGEEVTTIDPVLLRRSIGYAFQGVGLFPHLTVGDNVAITPRLLGWNADRTRCRIDELLALVDLPPETYRDRLPAGSDRHETRVEVDAGEEGQPLGPLRPERVEGSRADRCAPRLAGTHRLDRRPGLGGISPPRRGLDALTIGRAELVDEPGDVRGWNGPYIKSSILKDPWGKDYQFRNPGQHGDFDIYSYGADGQQGGEG